MTSSSILDRQESPSSYRSSSDPMNNPNAEKAMSSKSTRFHLWKQKSPRNSSTCIRPFTADEEDQEAKRLCGWIKYRNPLEKKAKWRSRYFVMTEGHLRLYTKQQPIEQEHHTFDVECSLDGRLFKKEHLLQQLSATVFEWKISGPECLNSPSSSSSHQFKCCSERCAKHWMNWIQWHRSMMMMMHDNQQEQHPVDYLASSSSSMTNEEPLQVISDHFRYPQSSTGSSRSSSIITASEEVEEEALHPRGGSSPSATMAMHWTDWIVRQLDQHLVMPLVQHFTTRPSSHQAIIMVPLDHHVQSPFSTCQDHHHQRHRVIPGSTHEILKSFLNLDEFRHWNASLVASASYLTTTVGTGEEIIPQPKVGQLDEPQRDEMLLTLHPIWLSPVGWTAPREFTLSRTWTRCRESGVISIDMTSTVPPLAFDHSSDSERNRNIIIRGQLLHSRMTISPAKVSRTNNNSSTTSLVTWTHLELDPRGWILEHFQSQYRNHCIQETLLNLQEEFERRMFHHRCAALDTKAKTMMIMPLMMKPRIMNNTSTLPVSMWSSPPRTSVFALRGPSYLEDRLKVKHEATSVYLTCTGVSLFKSQDKLSHVVAESQRREELLPDDVSPISFNQTLVVNFQLPGYSLVLTFERRRRDYCQDDDSDSSSTAYEEMWQTFFNSHPHLQDNHNNNDPNSIDLERNERLKIIPKLVEGGRVGLLVGPAMGSNTPVLLGTKLKTSYFQNSTNEYLEIDYDVSSSRLAASVVDLIKSSAKHLVIELALVLEAKTEPELPERLLACVQLSRVDFDAAVEF